LRLFKSILTKEGCLIVRCAGFGRRLRHLVHGAEGLTATRAATVQLAVPVLAAVSGVVLLSESISLRLLLSTAMILGGVGLTLVGRKHTVQPVETGSAAD
jgi:hypothetical protein